MQHPLITGQVFSDYFSVFSPLQSLLHGLKKDVFNLTLFFLNQVPHFLGLMAFPKQFSLQKQIHISTRFVQQQSEDKSASATPQPPKP